MTNYLICTECSDIDSAEYLTYLSLLKKEIWKDVPDYKGKYQASNLGRIRSTDTQVESNFMTTRRIITQKGKILKQVQTKTDKAASCTLSKDGYPSKHPVEELVMLAFVGPRAFGKEVRHIDGDKSNNELHNLTYAGSGKIDKPTAQHVIRLLIHRTDDEIAQLLSISAQDVKDIRERKTWRRLSRKQSVTETMAVEIRKMKSKGLTIQAIAEDLGISNATVWRYLEKEGDRYKKKPHYLPRQTDLQHRVLPTFKDKGWTTIDKNGRTVLTRLGLHMLAKSIIKDRITYEDAARYLRIPLKDMRHQLKILDIKKSQLSEYIDDRLEEASFDLAPSAKKEKETIPGFRF